MLVVGALGTAQAAEPALEQELTGGSSRAWLQDAPGAAPSAAGCGVPDSFTFSTTHQVAIGRCIEGRPVSTRHAWRVEGGHEQPRLLVPGLGDYAVTYAQAGAGGARRLLLRPLARDGGASVVELRSQPD